MKHNFINICKSPEGTLDETYTKEDTRYESDNDDYLSLKSEILSSTCPGYQTKPVLPLCCNEQLLVYEAS